MIKCYFITYDLNQPGQDYDAVQNAIFRISNYGCISFWRSSYLIKTSLLNASEVMNEIRPALDENDKVIVFEFTVDWNGHLDDEQTALIHKLLIGV